VHARVGIVQMSPRTFEQGVKMMGTQALPSLRLLDGYRGALLLGDRESGKALYLTFWESEAAVRRSEEDAAALRDDSAEALGTEPIPVERYEVLVSEFPAD
jgi:heme-degrading monooxygenase HmoA